MTSKTYHVNKILVPLDFSKTSLLAIDHAAATAKAFGATLILLHVVEKNWEKFSIITPELRVKEPDNLVQRIEGKLEEVAADIRARFAVETIAITGHGNIFSEILSVSEEHSADLVIMGTHGTSGIVEFFIGSNTYKVVTESACPVLSVAASAGSGGFRNIVLPIDNSLHSRQKVNYGVIMARAFNATVHVLGLDDLEDDEEQRRIFTFKLEQVKEYVEKCGVSCTMQSIRGSNQAKMTMDFASSQRADLIVIMSDQDENLTGRLLGTYAQQIVNHSKVPVLTIKPVLGKIEFPSLGGGYHAPEGA